MARLIAFVILGACFAFLFKSRWMWSINQARLRGIYPEKGKATMFDVRRLIQKGEKDLAVRLYCEIFLTNSKEAKIAIEELERSIQEKDSEIE